jgi:Steigviridae/Suoliviridae L,D-carboxypeptidase/transpeptidase
MELVSTRRWYTSTSTIGELSNGSGDRFCFVLEDTVRDPGIKVPGKTAIPAGRYRLVVDWSNRFRKYAFHILDVPNFAGIRIHSGNTDADTEGCLLVGEERALNAIFGSHKAFSALWAALTEPAGFDAEHDCQSFRMKQDTWITIIDDGMERPR